MNLNEIAIFVKIVESGSFIQAAKLLEMPKSTVSARLSSLEKRLGLSLIRRTTRQLHLTEAGKIYYAQCLKALSDIAVVEEELLSAHQSPRGLLKITAPVDLGEVLFPYVLPQFKQEYPDVGVEIFLTDKMVDLVASGMDLGLRTGHLQDSSMISKQLGQLYFAPFASPHYLKNHPALKEPRDLLTDHALIHFSPLLNNQWPLIKEKEKEKLEKEVVKIEKKMVMNDLHLIKSLCVAGQGVALLPTFLCYEEIKKGQLVRVLKEWRTEPRPVQFVYHAEKFVTARVKAFLQMATPIFKKHLMVD